MTIDRLRAHYGFTRQPFGRDLAPGQLFTGRAHQEAVARLRWLIDEHAIGVVTGEVGAGKTVAARATVASLDTSRHTIIYLANPMVGARGIHHHLVCALGAVPRFHRPALLAQTAELLAAEHDERRKQVLLIVDEGHLLSVDQLEQLRLLTNTDMDLLTELRDPSSQFSSQIPVWAVTVRGHVRTTRAAPGSGRLGHPVAGVLRRYR